MTKRLLILVSSFLLLVILSFTSVIPTEAAPYREPLLPTTAETGLIYGPPQPEQIPTLASRGGSVSKENLKDVLKVVPETLTYQVQPGDTLYEIASRFDLKLDDLRQMNNITEPSLLRIGQMLHIPNKERKEIDTGYEIKQVLSSDLTAYTAGPESTGKTPDHPAYGITASGKKVKDYQTIAVDPSVIPLGSKVYIEGLGIRIAEDTGGAILGNRIDVYMSNLSDAINFGYKRNIKVYLLEDKQTS